MKDIVNNSEKVHPWSGDGFLLNIANVASPTYKRINVTIGRGTFVLGKGGEQEMELKTKLAEADDLRRKIRENLGPQRTDDAQNNNGEKGRNNTLDIMLKIVSSTKQT